MSGGPVVIAGGGTAGHVYPGLSLARVLRDRGHDVAFVGTERGVEARLVPAAGFAFHAVPARPFSRKLSADTLRAPFVALAASKRCRPLARQAGAVVGMGGYVSISAVLAAKRERTPVVLHEQNAVPGLANRALARISSAVALSFPDGRAAFGRHPRLELTGNPVREEILRVPEERDALAKEGREVLDLEDGRRTVVIFGGSQGALHIDRAAAGACRLLSGRSDIQVVLITGPAHADSIRPGLPPRDAALLVRPFPYVERMELAYACADLIVSRAGATTVAELTVCGLPSLLIPYPYATRNHQEANARAVQRAGAASVLLDDQLSADVLARRITDLLDAPDRLETMSGRARSFGRPDAAARLADLVEAVAR